MNIRITYLLLFWFSYSWSNASIANDTLIISSTSTTHRAGKYLTTFEDTSNQKTFQDILNETSFVPSESEIPNFEVTKSTYWAKLIVKNSTAITEDFILEFEKVTADRLTLYYNNNEDSSVFNKIDYKQGQKKYKNRLFLFDIAIPKQTSTTIYICYKTNWATTFPILIGAKEKILERIFNNELLKGIYLGILFIMVFYNFFIYISIRDKSYLYYVIYIFFFLLMQVNDFGYIYKYLLYNHPIYYDIGLKTLPSLTSISAILFVRNFLKTSSNSPVLDKGLNYLLIAFSLLLLFVFNNKDNGLYFIVINLLTLVVAIYLLVTGVVLSFKRTFLAKYFLIAWSILLLSIIQFNFSNLDLIPYYEITDHSLEIGSLIEVFLLSLALAYRINLLKKEKELSQEKTLVLVKEKKNIIKNQNEILEKLVSKRTLELESQNEIILEKNEEKSVMMREIHHRVKNNLQMINSMVRMQSRFINKEDAANSLKEVGQRIQTMALLHEKMYQTENLASINIREYITTVLKDLLSISHNDIKFEYKVAVPDVNFKPESILYIGLLINELITNSLKHGFKDQKEGYIYIKLHKTSTNEYLLNVSNNGQKIDVDKFNASHSLGQRLIRSFVKQLNGTLTIQANDDVSTFSIRFQEI